MRRERRCPKCGSDEIIADAKVVDHTYGGEVEMTVATYRHPGSLFFKQKVTTSVSAWVCGACGYIEFYADRPAVLDATLASVADEVPAELPFDPAVGLPDEAAEEEGTPRRTRRRRPAWPAATSSTRPPSAARPAAGRGRRTCRTRADPAARPPDLLP